MKILNQQDTLDRSNDTRSQLYRNMARGVFTRGVKSSGLRAVGWPEHEVDAIVTARVGGATEDELRDLVDHLHAQRESAKREVLARVAIDRGTAAQMPRNTLPRQLAPGVRGT